MGEEGKKKEFFFENVLNDKCIEMNKNRNEKMLSKLMKKCKHYPTACSTSGACRIKTINYT